MKKFGAKNVSIIISIILGASGIIYNSFLTEETAFSVPAKVISAVALVYAAVMLICNMVHLISVKSSPDKASAEAKENKAFKTLLAVSFLPVTVLLGVSIYAMFSGVPAGHFGDLEAFNASFVYWGFAMCAIPVLPAALIYQGVYLAKKLSAKMG